MVHSDLQEIAKRILLRLMRLLYTFGVRIYALAIFLARPFNQKAKSWWSGRQLQKWKTFENSDKRKVIWFHCASLGEFDMALPLMREWKKKEESVLLVCTFFSPSGMLHYKKRNHPIDFAFYLPIDTKRNAQEFLKKLKPSLAIFIKYEFWGNHLLEAKKRDIKLVSLCSIFRKNQVFFKKYGLFQRKLLHLFDLHLVQNEASKNLLNGIGVKNIKIIGDLRFQTVIENKSLVKANEVLHNFSLDESVFIIGSSWPIDEKFLLPFVEEISKRYKIIWAPHNVDSKSVQNLDKKIISTSIRYTNYIPDSKARILILDTIGHLSSAYSYGFMAYVGGGQTGALHNILEPAAYGLPVIFGPKHNKFPEAKLFLEKGFSMEAYDSKTMKEAFEKLNQNREQRSEDIQEFMHEFDGLSERIYDQIIQLRK